MSEVRQNDARGDREEALRGDLEPLFFLSAAKQAARFFLASISTLSHTDSEDVPEKENVIRKPKLKIKMIGNVVVLPYP
jgi:hypothetical protein